MKEKYLDDKMDDIRMFIDGFNGSHISGNIIPFTTFFSVENLFEDFNRSETFNCSPGSEKHNRAVFRLDFLNFDEVVVNDLLPFRDIIISDTQNLLEQN